MWAWAHPYVYSRSLQSPCATPQGLGNDLGLSLCGTGWNTGANGDADTCTSAANSQSCCYNSCSRLGKCTITEKNCGWSTCYDDVHFTAELIEHVGDRACIDLDAVFVSGASNGGMASFTVADGIPGVVAGVVPVFGLPLRGHLGTAPAIPYMFLSGRQDRVVPIDGSLSDQGWYYVSAVDAAAAYAKANGCSGDTVAMATPYDGGAINLACTEHPDCAGDTAVLTCLYDGGHSLPPNQIGEGITVWFLSRYMNATAQQRVATE